MLKKLVIFLLLISFNLYGKDIHYKDVPEDHWALPAIRNIVKLGVAKGYSNDTFKGDKLINRYELMVFMSNLSIAMEKMMDEKLEEALLSDDEKVSDRALDELKLNIDVLKEEVVSLKQSKKTPGKWKIISGVESRYYESTIKDISGYPDDDLFKLDDYRINVSAINNIDNHNLIEIDIDSGYQCWNNMTTRGISSRVFAAKYTASRVVAKDIDSKFYLSVGPGDYIRNDSTVAYRYGNRIGTDWDVYGVNVSGFFEKRTSLNERTKVDIGYNFPIVIPYLGKYGFNYSADTYYKSITPNLSNVRTIFENRLEFIKNIGMTYKEVKDIRSDEQKSSYTNTELYFNKLWKGRIDLSFSYAWKDTGFGSSFLNEEIEGMNYAGYRSCEYFTSNMPSGDIRIESGGLIKAKLTNYLDSYISVVQGTAKGDADLGNDGINYTYTLQKAGMVFKFTDMLDIVLENEVNSLKEKNVAKDIYTERINLISLKGRF